MNNQIQIKRKQESQTTVMDLFEHREILFGFTALCMVILIASVLCILYMQPHSTNEVSRPAAEILLENPDSTAVRLRSRILTTGSELWRSAKNLVGLNPGIPKSETGPQLLPVQEVYPVQGSIEVVAASQLEANGTEPLALPGLTNSPGSSLQVRASSNYTRAEAAVFGLRLRHGRSYTPPGPVGIFADVQTDNRAAGWIEASWNEGLMDPCQTSPQLLFCPDSQLTYDEAFLLLDRALKPLPVPTSPEPTIDPIITADPTTQPSRQPTAEPSRTVEPPASTPTTMPPITATSIPPTPLPPTAVPTFTSEPTSPPSPSPTAPQPTEQPPGRGTSTPVAVITVLHDTSERMDDFSNTTILDTRTIRFRIDDSYDPDGLSQLQNGGSYYVRIHSRRFNGCGIVWREPPQSHGQIQGRIFEVTLNEIGYYSVELTVTDNTGRENKTRFYFYTKVSPQGLGPEPAGNQAPAPVVTIANVVGGSGSRNDPYRVPGEMMYFNMLNSTDPDGKADLEQGLFAYQIDAKGLHPFHSGLHTYQAMEQQDFSFNMKQIGSETAFSIDAYVIDRWGRVSLRTFHCSRIP
jgi:hypothetical protein